MESEIIDAIIFMCLGIGFHYFKIYMDKLYLKKKDEYNQFLKEDKSQSKMEYHKRTAKIEIFESYNKWLTVFKWFCWIGTIFILYRGFSKIL
ncbi:MAG: hypothetical protein IM568_05315 [Flavobacterium sp.]|nr:hypothetical protein [Flavobacterium sp.]